MPVPVQPLPTVGQSNSTEDPKVRSVLSELQSILTGTLDATNIANGVVTDAKMASPNNAVWRTLAESPVQIGGSTSAGSYFCTASAAIVPSGSGASGIMPVLLDPAEFVVAGKTAKLRLKIMGVTGGALTINPTFGMYVISSLSGGATAAPTLGAALTGSAVAFSSSPAALATVSCVTGSFDFPATFAYYLFGVNLGVGTPANVVFTGRMQLSISHQ